MAGRIILTADSSCDLDEELIKRYEIKIIPFHIILDETEYLDNVDIFSENIFENYKNTGILPKTSAISVGEFIAFFRQWLTGDNRIIHIAISSNVSSAYQNSKTASDILGGNIICYDTYNLSSGMGIFAVKAGEMIKKGFSPEEIIEELDKIKNNISMTFMIDTMEYLKAGGRCSALAAMGANMLKIHPCIEVKPETGTMGVCKKYRGEYGNILKQYVSDRLISNIEDIDDSIAFITCPETEAYLIDIVEEAIKSCNYFKEIHKTKASSTVASHCGPNTVGLTYLRKA